ncbi:MAG: Crp/Fnr family transcriptional regulator [Alphaproteobacteria bacterium]|nr:Crp/Fnr family transcriptional regulator [Alphaproteobacteria bacterium]
MSFLTSTKVAPVDTVGVRQLGGSVAARRLGALGPLTPDDLRLLNSMRGRSFDPGATIEDPSEPNETGWMVLSGWCARMSSGAATHRQITTILLPGDGFGIGAAPWAGDRLPVYALSPCVLVDATVLRQLVRLRSPVHAKLIEACRKAAWLEQIYALNQISRLGGQNAFCRVAHFLMELYVRLDQVGLVRANTFVTPLKQQILAEILGLSGVHLNRTMRLLKHEGLVSLSRGAIHIPDPTRLSEVAQFDRDAMTTPP